jgi:hypothetical protein
MLLLCSHLGRGGSLEAEMGEDEERSGPGREDPGAGGGEGAAPVAGGGRRLREASADAAADEGGRLQANKNREAQLARTGGRRLFKGKARKRFLKWFAATGNVVWSAAKAGFSDKTIWKHRMNDPRFAEAFDRAFEQSVARNKARMLERRMTAKPIAVDGGAGEAELEDCDLEKAWPLIVEIERARGRSGGASAGRPRKAGRPPRVASNREVRAALEKRLRAFGRRIRAGGTAPPPSPADFQEKSGVPGTEEESSVPGAGETAEVEEGPRTGGPSTPASGGGPPHSDPGGVAHGEEPG